mgnify:CR=1 FL=1
MLTYSFDNIGSDCLYIYLYKCIKNDIIQRILKAGEKLPSKRNLARNLNISVITVENAYEQLFIPYLKKVFLCQRSIPPLLKPEI